jgi:hypothetical protein
MCLLPRAPLSAGADSPTVSLRSSLEALTDAEREELLASIGKACVVCATCSQVRAGVVIRAARSSQ